MTNALEALSTAISQCVATADSRIVGLQSHGGRTSSGLIWSEDHIVTADEALADEGELSLTLADGRTVTAEVVGRDPSTDVALLKAETGLVEPWELASTPAVGSLAIAIGRGTGSPLAALGVVSEIGPAWTSMSGGRIDARIQLAMQLSRRAEGGAIVAPNGALIGMAVSGPRRRVLAIPGSTIQRAVLALSEKGYVARGYLGLSLQALNRRGTISGVVVADIERDSPAAEAGFVIGDIITIWNGDPVGGVGDVARRLGTDAVGSRVTLAVMRAGELAERSMTIGERPLVR